MNKISSIIFVGASISTVVVEGVSIRGQPKKPIIEDNNNNIGNNNRQQQRNLEVSTVSGACTVANFAASVNGGQATLASYLGVANQEEDIQKELDRKCAEALEPSVDLADALERGPQFLKNFLDGGTTWNDNYETVDGKYVLSEDAAIIQTLYDSKAKSAVFGAPDGGANAQYPQYFSNFYNGEKECRLGVIECCYTASRHPDKDKDDSLGLEDNAEMCALDLTLASESNHIQNPAYRPSFTFYGTQGHDDSYCSGFAWEEDSFADSVKYNTLFHMAMWTNLYNKHYVKNIPGAPMCGCLEQMPIVDYAACVKAKEGYTIDSSGTVGVAMDWEECGTDLYSYYESLEKRSNTLKYFVKEKIVGQGQCATAAMSFMNEQMYKKYVPPPPLNCPESWVQVGEINANIGGCGLTSCNDRYDKETIEECAEHCAADERCESFTFAPLNGDRNHPGKIVCTIYNSDVQTSTWSPRQILCKPDSFS